MEVMIILMLVAFIIGLISGFALAKPHIVQ